MLSMHADPQYVRNAFDAGVKGYILKNVLETDLIGAVRTVAAGGRFLSPELASSPEPDDAFAKLSAREVQVLRLIALGKSNKEIAVDSRRQRQYRGRAPDQPDVHARHSQGGRAGADRGEERTGEPAVIKPWLVATAVITGGAVLAQTQGAETGFRLTDVTAASQVAFWHLNGAFGKEVPAGDARIRRRRLRRRRRRPPGRAVRQRLDLAGAAAAHIGRDARGSIATSAARRSRM